MFGGDVCSSLFVELQEVAVRSYIQHVLNECVIKNPEAAKKNIFSEIYFSLWSVILWVESY